MSIELEFLLRWKGMLEVVYSCEDAEDVQQNIRILRDKLLSLEESKNIEDTKEAFESFTEEEINYLNSSLLDEIHKSISTKNPLFEACQNNFMNAVKFYLERMESCEILHNHLFITSSVEIMELLLEKNPELKKYRAPFFRSAIKLSNVNIVKALYDSILNFQEKELYTMMIFKYGRHCENIMDILPKNLWPF